MAMVELMDDTLREGMQTPGVMFSAQEKLTISRMLVDVGVKTLEVSYPSAHKSEQNATKSILSDLRGTRTSIFGLGRALPGDIDAIASTGANIALHLPFNGSNDEALKACRYARDQYPDRKLAVALVDVGSYGPASLLTTVKGFDRAGVDCLELPDTKGVLYPSRYGNIVRKVKENVSALVIAHCHNDRGLAVANSLAGVEAGADIVDCTVLGLGERNGIADIAVIADALEREGVRTGVSLRRLESVYRKVNKILLRKTGVPFLTANSPIYGEHLTTHTAGTHASSSAQFDTKRFSVNVYCGTAMIRRILSSKGKDFPDYILRETVAEVKDESSTTGRTISYQRVNQIAAELAKTKATKPNA